MQAQTLASPSEVALSDVQAHRLATANQVLVSYARADMRVFGVGDRQSRLEWMRLGGLRFVPSHPDADPIALNAAVRGPERIFPGFSGSYAEQRLVRYLAAYVLEGRPTVMASLMQALLANGNNPQDQCEQRCTEILSEFRFTKAFAKARFAA
ncbi:hypothetical protein [Pseudomonas gingeri]|uniref:hypothetical protein n=1 Tax=Pseudomonas gingeri TaxID=117681 RepID=UPI0015A36191|nr:hypothetical protein [Pseudomonas gingeri]NWA11987.1 hypothetical protein [Pseudomonas gingeri]